MKHKKWLLFSIFAAILLVFAACNSEDSATDEAKTTDEGEATETETAETELAYEPEPIKDTDVCELCAMAVPDNQHATQIVLTNERSIKFDDIGCMIKWMKENGDEEVGMAFVRDYNTEEWFDVNEGTFVYHEEIMTPMAYGVISFKDANDAEAFIEEFGKGEILTRSDLDNHEWKMNKEMMEKMKEEHGHDHDDHEHDHDDHDHE